MKNYYKDILVQIEKHIDMNEDDKALTLIREELSLPYIPMETEKELHKFLELVNSKLISEKPFDIQKIFELINSPKFDGIDKLGTVEMLAKANLREYDVEIKEILHNKNKIVPFVFKVRLLMLLKEQNIDNKYELLNVDNKQITIDLKDVTLPQDNLAFAAESNRVNVLLERHPGVFTVALNLLENFYYAMFP
ncbi:MAG: hypothetical protein DRP42_01805 [Tenericutes bacterium]|nr:MAG: hypothetical protein DRP42_01805 [Mycoplasmatota bacterium]